MKKAIFYILFIFLLIAGEKTFAASIDAWPDFPTITTIKEHETVYLTGTLSWFSAWCEFTYSWVRNWWAWAAITINNSTSLVANFLWPFEILWWQDIIIDFNVNVSNCAEAWAYTDTVYYQVNPHFINTDAWNDVTVNENNNISLIWTYYWWDSVCWAPAYQWTQASNLGIDLFDEVTATSTNLDFLSPWVWSNQVFEIEFKVTCWVNEDIDTLILNVNNNWWSSSRVINEISAKFADISKLDFNIKKSEQNYNPLLKFEATNLWDSRYINYEFIISDDKNFKKSKLINTVYNDIYIDPNDYREYKNKIYLKARGYFNWIYTNYSNTLSFCLREDVLCDIDFINKNFLFNFDDLFDKFSDIDIFNLNFKKSYKSKIKFDY